MTKQEILAQQVAKSLNVYLDRSEINFFGDLDSALKQTMTCLDAAAYDGVKGARRAAIEWALEQFDTHHAITVCCTQCGGINVQHAVWISSNDERVIEDFGTWNNGDNTFCEDCQVNSDLITSGADPAEFRAARNKWAKNNIDAKRQRA